MANGPEYGLIICISEFPDINYRGRKGMTFLRGNIQYASGMEEDPEHNVFSSMTQATRHKDTGRYCCICACN